MSADAWGLTAQMPARPDDPWTAAEVATMGHRATEGADDGAVVDIRHGYLPAAEALNWLTLDAGTIPEGGSYTTSYQQAQKTIGEDPSTGISTSLWELWANLQVPLAPSVSTMLCPHDTIQGYLRGSVYVDTPSPTTITYSLTWDIDVYGIETQQDLPSLTWATRPTGDLLCSLGQESIGDGGASNNNGGSAYKYVPVVVVSNPSASKTYNTLRFVARIDSYSYSKPSGWTSATTIAQLLAERLQQLDALL